MAKKKKGKRAPAKKKAAKKTAKRGGAKKSAKKGGAKRGAKRGAAKKSGAKKAGGAKKSGGAKKPAAGGASPSWLSREESTPVTTPASTGTSGFSWSSGGAASAGEEE